MAANLIQEVTNLIARQAIVTATSTSRTTFATSTATTTTLPSMSGMPGMSGGEPSFFEKHKTLIIGAAIGIPLQVIAGFFYLRHRKAKKATAAAEKNILENRLAALEMGMGSTRKMDAFERVDVYASVGAGGKI